MKRNKAQKSMRKKKRMELSHARNTGCGKWILPVWHYGSWSRLRVDPSSSATVLEVLQVLSCVILRFSSVRNTTQRSWPLNIVFHLQGLNEIEENSSNSNTFVQKRITNTSTRFELCFRSKDPRRLRPFSSSGIRPNQQKNSRLIEREGMEDKEVWAQL